jgi:hypothetical protein
VQPTNRGWLGQNGSEDERDAVLNARFSRRPRGYIATCVCFAHDYITLRNPRLSQLDTLGANAQPFPRGEWRQERAICTERPGDREGRSHAALTRWAEECCGTVPWCSCHHVVMWMSTLRNAAHLEWPACVRLHRPRRHVSRDQTTRHRWAGWAGAGCGAQLAFCCRLITQGYGGVLGSSPAIGGMRMQFPG